jgi:6-phosphofructokinase
MAVPVSYYIHGRSLSWLATGTSIKSDAIKLVLRTQTYTLKNNLRKLCNFVRAAKKYENKLNIYIYIK